MTALGIFAFSDRAAALTKSDKLEMTLSWNVSRMSYYQRVGKEGMRHLLSLVVFSRGFGRFRGGGRVWILSRSGRGGGGRADVVCLWDGCVFAFWRARRTASVSFSKWGMRTVAICVESCIVTARYSETWSTLQYDARDYGEPNPSPNDTIQNNASNSIVSCPQPSNVL